MGLDKLEGDANAGFFAGLEERVSAEGDVSIFSASESGEGKAGGGFGKETVVDGWYAGPVSGSTGEDGWEDEGDVSAGGKVGVGGGDGGDAGAEPKLYPLESVVIPGLTEGEDGSDSS